MLQTYLAILALGLTADPVDPSVPAGAIQRLGPISVGKEGSAISSLAFFPDGKRLASGGHVGVIGGANCVGTVCVWDLKSGKALHRFALKGVANVALAPDGKFLAAAGCDDGVAIVWNAETGQELHRMEGRRGWNGNMPIAFAADGKTLAVGSHRIDVWDATTGKALQMLKTGEPVWRLAFDPEGKLLAFSCVDGIDQRLFRTSDWQEQKFPWPSCKSFAFSPCGQTMALEEGMYDRATGKQLRSWAIKSSHSLALSPDGRMLASVEGENGVVVWEVATGQRRRTLSGHRSHVSALAFSANGRWLASGSWDRTIVIWDLYGGRAEAEPETAWRRLAENNAAAALDAIGQLLKTPDQTISLLQQRLKPVAQSDELVSRMIADLDSNAFQVREAASARLAQLGPACLPALRQALLAKPSPEAKQRLEALLEKLQTEPLPAATIQNCRAIEVLEQLGSADARRLLAKLAGGAARAPETEAAAAALRRMAGK
jgi:hypothetical protein